MWDRRDGSARTASPVSLACNSDAHDLTPALENMYRAMGQEVPAYKDSEDRTELAETTELLYGLAVLAEGGQPHEPARPVKLMTERQECALRSGFGQTPARPGRMGRPPTVEPAARAASAGAEPRSPICARRTLPVPRACGRRTCRAHSMRVEAGVRPESCPSRLQLLSGRHERLPVSPSLGHGDVASAASFPFLLELLMLVEVHLNACQLQRLAQSVDHRCGQEHQQRDARFVPVRVYHALSDALTAGGRQ